MKELPYFRFTCQEWQNGDISLESYSVKGLYIDICSYYWINCCDILFKKVQKKFKKESKNIQKLIDLEIIKIIDDYIRISFLDDQWAELSAFREKKRIAGSKGGKQKASNATAQPKHNSSYKDKEKDKDKDKENIYRVVLFLNQTTNQNYRPETSKTQSLIKSRLKENFTLDDFQTVILKKSREWGNTDMSKYLRPETLFGPKFESYLNAKETESEGDRLSKIYNIPAATN